MATPERIRQLAALFSRCWREGTGRSGPSRAELQIALGICGVEGWGSWDGEMVGSNNFGGDQTSSANGDGIHYHGVPHGDQHLDGTKYTTFFRYYDDGGGHTAEENGAIDFLKVLSAPQRPLTAKAFGTGSAAAVAGAMHREHYYEGFPPDPIAGYASGIVKHAAEAAAALGQPLDVYGGSNNFLTYAALAALAYLLWE